MKKIIAIALIALSAALYFACDMNNAPEAKAGGGSVTLNIGEARTLFPNTDFAYYTITGVGPSDATYGSEEHLEPQAAYTLSNLAPGAWTFTVTGISEAVGPFVYDEAEPMYFEAAKGTVTVTVSAASPAVASVTLENLSEEGEGVFTWMINIPDNVTSASLSLNRLGVVPEDFIPPEEVNLIEPGSEDVAYNNKFENGTASGYNVVPAGWYILTISLTAANEDDYQVAGVTEVVHIYANMETQALGYNFDEDDFVSYITIGGTASYKVDRQDQDYFNIYAFANEKATGVTIGSAYVDSGTWTMKVPKPKTTSTYYFFVERTDYNTYTSEYILAGSQNIDPEAAAPTNIVLAANYENLELSGTVAYTKEGELSNCSVYVFDNPNPTDIYNPLANASYDMMEYNETNYKWTTTIPKVKQDTTLYFFVYDPYEGKLIPPATSINVTPSDTTKTAITVTASYTQLKLTGGALEVEVAAGLDEYYSGNGIYIYDNPDASGEPLGEKWSEWPTLDSTLADAGKTLYFFIDYYGKRLVGSQKLTAGTYSYEISFAKKTIDKLTLSGTIDGKVPQADEYPDDPDYYLALQEYKNGESVMNYGYIPLNSSDTTWSISIPAPEKAAEYKIGIDASGKGESRFYPFHEGTISVAANATSKTGIALHGNVTTLKGTLDLTVNNEKQGYASIYIYDNAQFSGTSLSNPENYYDLSETWSILLYNIAEGTTLYFKVGGTSMGFYQLSQTVTIGSKALETVSLTHNASNVVLAGTMSVKVNSESISWSENMYGELEVFDNAAYSGAPVATISRSTPFDLRYENDWEAVLPAGNKTLYFRLALMEYDNYNGAYVSTGKYYNFTQTASNSAAKLDIALSLNIEKLLISGTINSLTLDGINTSLSGSAGSAATLQLYDGNTLVAEYSFNNYYMAAGSVRSVGITPFGGYDSGSSGAWSFSIDKPSIAKTLSLRIKVPGNYDGGGLIATLGYPISVSPSSESIDDIALGEIVITSRTVAVTASDFGANCDFYAVRAVPSGAAAVQSLAVSVDSTTSGKSISSLTMPAEYDSVWYVVVDRAEGKAYITQSAISGASVVLNKSELKLLE